MMKASIVVLCFAAFQAAYGWPPKCPQLQSNAYTNIDFSQIQGEWKVVAGKPDHSSNCLNITIATSENDSESSLQESYFTKRFFFWKVRSSSNYKIQKELITPVLSLKNKAWYSIESEKYTLIDVKYDTYALFYQCTSNLFKIKEEYQLWTRDEVDPNNLPVGIAESLKKYNLVPTDLTFRTVADCTK